MGLQDQPHLFVIAGLLGSYSAVRAAAIPDLAKRSQVYCTSASWVDILVFYLLNYVAHAATVRSLPGNKTTVTTAWAIAALFIPYSGIVRGCDSITHAKLLGESDLEHAARARALCCLVRTRDWEPKEAENLPGCRVSPLERKTTSGILTVNFNCGDFFLDNGYRQLLPSEERIHGQIPSSFPPGYSLVRLASRVKVRPLHSESQLLLSRSCNTLRSLVALGQLLFACVTLYRTRDGQIAQFGTSAFGLTVVPYAVMSLINFISGIVTPDYPCIFLVRSEVMSEAERRGAHFDGVVGELDIPTDNQGSRTLRIEAVEGRIKIPHIREVEGRRIKFQELENLHDENIVSDNLGDSQPSDDIAEEVEVVVSAIGRHTLRPTNYYREGIALGIGVLALLAPYIVILALVGNIPTTGTSAQQGWTSAWLMCGQLSGILIGIIGLEGGIVKLSIRNMMVILVVAAPAIGGFVTVGQMIIQYGLCTLVD